MTQDKPTDIITITRPDDWHVHLRDGDALQYTVPDVAREFARAICMPNLKPPVLTLQDAINYRIRILDALPEDSDFTPLMTLYLTDNTTPEEIVRAKASGLVHAVKLYPAGATTNSDAGVTSWEKVYPALEAMQYFGMPLLVHGEIPEPQIDMFDREKHFIDRVRSSNLLEAFPNLKVVIEHITTREATEFVMSAGPNVAATITAHHMLYNRNALLQGGVHPHWYCLPILKREDHRLALVEAAISGNPKFFLGTDSAPHAKMTKEASCGCAGCYTAHGALALYVEVFDTAGALDKLEAFASFHGPDFYDLPRNKDTVTLVREEWVMDESFPYVDGDSLIPLRAGAQMHWKIAP